MTSALDHAAIAAGEALRAVAWDRERGLNGTTPEMLRRVASAVIAAHEGGRTCQSCRWWERFGGEPWGECLLAGDERAEPLRFYLAGESGGLITEEGHGCRAWKGRSDE